MLHHLVLCDSSPTMRSIWANSLGTCFSTPWSLAKWGKENAMQNTEIWLDCSPDSMVTETVLPCFMWAAGCKTSICCCLCFPPRRTEDEWGGKEVNKLIRIVIWFRGSDVATLSLMDHATIKMWVCYPENSAWGRKRQKITVQWASQSWHFVDLGLDN